MNYERMQPVVDAICESLKTEADTWNIATYGIKRPGKFDDREIKKDGFMQIWTGNTWERVFSYEQGTQIEKALNEALTQRGTDLQDNLLEGLS